MSCQSCSRSCGGCSNAGSCGGCHGCHPNTPLNEKEREILMQLAQTPFLPLVRFARRESYFAPTEPLEPSPVYLTTGSETTAEVELTTLALRRLAARGFVTLDYDIPLSGFDYLFYRQSALAARLAELNPGYTIVTEKGSMALTAAGQDAVDDPEL